MQNCGAHVSQRRLDPLLALALALEEFVHDVRGLVYTDAQTHDQKDECDDIQLHAEVVDGGLDDDHDVDDARGHDERARDVVEHDVDHGHDAPTWGQQELQQLGLQHAFQREDAHELLALAQRAQRPLAGQHLRVIHDRHHVLCLGPLYLEGYRCVLDCLVFFEVNGRPNLSVDCFECMQTRVKLVGWYQPTYESHGCAWVSAVAFAHPIVEVILPRVLVALLKWPFFGFVTNGYHLLLNHEWRLVSVFIEHVKLCRYACNSQVLASF